MANFIGNKPNQVPTNGDLGTLAFQDDDAATLISPAISGNVVTTGLNFDSNTFVIDATNNRVGVGTASPSTALDISSANAIVLIGTKTASSTNSGLIGFRSDTGTLRYYAGILQQAAATNFTIFDAVAGLNRVVLDSSGNLGLGVTPSAWVSTAKVLVLGSTQSGTIAALSGGSFSMENNSYTNTSGVGTYIATGYATRYYQSSGGAHVWNTAPSGTAGNAITFTQAMTLHASGGLSIGNTTNPGGGNLSVSGDGTNQNSSFATPATGYSVLSAGNASGNITIGIDNVAGAVYGQGSYTRVLNSTGAYPLTFRTNSAERMRIDASGNVGIGTNSPAYKLDVSGVIRGTGNIVSGDGSAFVFGTGTTSYLSGSSSSNVITAFTNSSERLRINSSGTLLIGTTASTDSTSVPKVQVAAGSNSTTTIQGMPCGLLINNTYNGATTGQGISMKFQMSSAEAGKYAAIAGIGDGAYSNTMALAFYTTANAAAGADNVTERMRIDSSGNVGIGSAAVASNTLRYFDLYNIDSGTNAGVINRLITNNVANSGTTSVDIIKYRTGVFYLNNNETNSAAATAFGIGGTERMRITSTGQLRTTVTGTTMMDDYGCRAWVNFNGTGTVAIRASGNVSSITDNGTGNYTVNFTTAMPDANYSFSGNIGYLNATGGAVNRTCQAETASIATGSIKVLTGIASSSTLEDQGSVLVHIFR